MSEQIEATSIEHTKGYIPVVHLSDGSSVSLNELIEQASMWRSAANRAGLWERKAGKIIEQAGAWKRRALAAESDLELAREQARYREGELVRSGHQQLLEAQANALDTIQRIAAQLPTEPIIDAEVVVPDVEVDTWFGEDDTPVVQIDTHRGHGRLRINLNDGVVWDGDPETDERPGKNAELIEWEQRALAQAETISRQLDTIRDQAEKIEELVQTLKNRNGEGDPADPGAHGGAIPRYGMLDVWQAIQRSADVRAFDAFYDHHGYAEAWATLLAELRKLRDDLDRRERLSDDDARAVRALQARKVELEAEVRAERGALAVCQTQLTDAKAALAESERAFSAIDAARVELAAQLQQARDGIDRQAGEINETASARDWWKAEHAAAVKRINDANDAKAEAITHCNEQLEALAQTAKLRDHQVETLSRMWVAKADDERSLFGAVFARQLYRVFADHGIDVERDMPAYPANVGVLITPAERLVTEHAKLANAATQLAALTLGQAVSGAPKAHDTARYVLRLVGGKAGPASEQPVTDRILREYNHLREHAELVASIGVKATGPFYPAPLRDAIKELNGALKNGAPEPTPDIADCA